MAITPIIVGVADNPSADTLWTTGNVCNTNFIFLDESLRGKPWLSTLNYKVGELVTEDSKIYIALLDNNNLLPSANSVEWQVISTGAGVWSNILDYVVGDIVSEGTDIYVSITNNIDELPSNSPSYWVLAGGSGSGGVIVTPTDSKKILVANDIGDDSGWKGTAEDEADINDVNFIDATFARSGDDAYKWTRHLRRHTIQQYLEDYEDKTDIGNSAINIVVNTSANIFYTDINIPTTLSLDTVNMPINSTASYIHIIKQVNAIWQNISYGAGWGTLKISDQVNNYPFDLSTANDIHILAYLIHKDGGGSLTTYFNVIGTNYA